MIDSLHLLNTSGYNSYDEETPPSLPPSPPVSPTYSPPDSPSDIPGSSAQHAQNMENSQYDIDIFNEKYGRYCTCPCTLRGGYICSYLTYPMDCDGLCDFCFPDNPDAKDSEIGGNCRCPCDSCVTSRMMFGIQCEECIDEDNDEDEEMEETAEEYNRRTTYSTPPIYDLNDTSSEESAVEEEEGNADDYGY